MRRTYAKNARNPDLFNLLRLRANGLLRQDGGALTSRAIRCEGISSTPLSQYFYSVPDAHQWPTAPYAPSCADHCVEPGVHDHRGAAHGFKVGAQRRFLTDRLRALQMRRPQSPASELPQLGTIDLCEIPRYTGYVCQQFLEGDRREKSSNRYNSKIRILHNSNKTNAGSDF